MAKYPIKKEFFPFSLFKPPLSKAFLKITVPFIKVPKFIYKDETLDAKRYKITSYDGEKIECFLFSPKEANGNSPCLIYIHGGGFVLPAGAYHYRNAMCYAKELNCKVWFINCRLAPKYTFPKFFEDCYEATRYLYDNAENFRIDKTKIGIGGDSAGSTLSVGVCMMAKDRNHPIKFLFQMLPYPFLDMRGESSSNEKYTDTPMWNSKLSKKVFPMIKVDNKSPAYVYTSPVEATTFEYAPPTYIELAEFDCLRDDGILYAKRLQEAGIAVTVNEIKGTMHGFDIKQKAPTSQQALSARIAFMRKMFNQS